ncbi:hypothetical protein [Kitasatospora viridis]|uniref:Uncharacterized protein n=1 Tax=Kitasatospora viridis TaxID=281105 RepID=A0A561SF97_9ACTN|nr:hypothetical protein [Kitasatospora viridis]TWF73546.1 hypothetical protein FHX73_15159 [Kitasatospora viridis]
MVSAWITLLAVLALPVLYAVVAIIVALNPSKPARSYPAPRPAPPPSPAPAPAPSPTGEPASHRESDAWLAAYRRAHPDATPAMEAAAAHEFYEDRTKYRGMSPGMKSALKAIEEQQRGTGWDGDWAR